MPFNETAVYMDKHSKHEKPSGSSSRDSKLSSPTVQSMGKPIDNPLIKYQGCKWEQVFDFDKVLKQIRNAERYYLRGKHDQGSGSSKSIIARGSFPRREQPQVQRLSSNDMHFYGMVPKQPFDVVVCDICLGIYTKMGFNNHMKLNHPQAWNVVSSKTSTTKEFSDTVEENLRESNTTVNLLTEQTTASTTTTAAAVSASSSRHKSSKSSSGSGGSSGSSRSRSKSKHHHHYHQQQHQQRSSSASTVTGTASSHASQTAASNAEMSNSSASTKSSKKTGLSGLSSVESKILSVSVPKDIHPDIQPVPLFSSTSSVSLPPPPKTICADVSGTQQDIVFPSSSSASKEKPKASKRKSKNISVLSLPPPESNESSNSSVEFTAVAAGAAVSATITTAAASTPSKSISKRTKPKGKDMKQLMDPQLSELDKAISSITGGQNDSISETINHHEIDCNRSILNTPPLVTTSASSLGYNTEEVSPMPMSVQVPLTSTQRSHYNSVQMLSETATTSNNLHQQQLQPQRSLNGEDNDNSILTLEDMLDSKFIHEILNTEESEIHFDESELDKVAQQQQQQQQQQLQQEFMHTIANKRMRYDEQIGNIDNVVQQATLPGKYATFQQQQTQQSFHVTNLEDIKMYTTAIDPMQLQQLLYQQQQQQHQQGLSAYGVGSGLDEVTAAALEQQQYNDSDVIMCSAEQLHKEGKINAADYATLAALSGNGGNTFSSVVPNNVCDVNAIAAAAQFQVYNIPSLTDDDVVVPNNTNIVDSKLGDVIIPQNHYVLPAEGNDDEEQLIYEITANNQVAVISQQRQQQMIAEFLTQAGYDSVDNVNVNVNINADAVLPDDAAAEGKFTNTFENDNNNELMDFDYSRLDIVKSCSSSNSSSADSKGAVKSEHNPKLISPSQIADDIFLNVFLYSGLPRPMAVNSFGLCKLPQGVATTFRKNLHATRKANNSPISLNANSSRFSSNVPNVAKSTATQNYFTALGGSTTTTTGNMMNEFSIGSITITNQQTSSQNSNNAQQQKQTLVVQSPIELVNGLVTTVSATSPSTASNARSSRPKSAGSTNSSGSNQSKQKTGSNSTSSNNNNATTVLPLSQNQAKTTIVVNANNGNNANNANQQTKFIKRSLITKTANSTPRSYTNFTAKQLSEILLNPSKEKYLQLLTTKDHDKDGGVSTEQRLNNVRNFYERRKRLLNGTTSNGNGYNIVRQLNTQHPATATPAGLKQKFLRQRLLRTLSDCGINSIKTSSNSANNTGNNDILRVS